MSKFHQHQHQHQYHQALFAFDAAYLKTDKTQEQHCYA